MSNAYKTQQKNDTLPYDTQTQQNEFLKHNQKLIANAFQTQRKTTNVRMALRHDKKLCEVITATVTALRGPLCFCVSCLCHACSPVRKFD